MSKEAFVQFCEKVTREDQPLLSELASQASPDEFARLAVEKGRAAGFDFDEAEALEVIRAAREQRAATELSEAELQGVSGGFQGLGIFKVTTDDVAAAGNTKWQNITLKRGS